MNTDILWLPSWYPNLLSPYNGDFIQRHAKAVSLFNKITVIFVKKDENADVTHDIKEIISTENNLKEIIIYYHPFKTRIYLFDKIISGLKYKIVYRAAVKKYIAQTGKPHLVHLHVALKAGTIALWLKRKFKIPYILSEHWSGYFKENRSALDQLNIFQKKWLRDIIKNADKLTVVSTVLGEAMKNYFGNLRYEIIPNTVDTSIFFPSESIVNATPLFIHISTLTYEKNPAQIIEAFSILNRKGYAFNLIIYAPENAGIKLLAKEKNLADFIEFRDEVPQAILAAELKRADALILFSHYETFGCVVIEANACGVPAILSDLNVFKEYVEENVNGIFARAGDANDLSEKLIEFIYKKYQFDRIKISENAVKRFSYHTIGKKISEVYTNY